jgi:hypothetical protein
MAAKTRSQLKTQSDNTFLDNSSGEIIPVNHREFNDDTIDSFANLEDTNTFEEQNTFNAQINVEGGMTVINVEPLFATTINSNVPFGATALDIPDGFIVLTNGGIQVGGPSEFGGINVNGIANFQASSEFNSFVPLIVNVPDGNALYSENGSVILENGRLNVGGDVFIEGLVQLNNYDTNILAAANIDLSSISASVIYIEGSTTINGFTGLANQIVYLTFLNDVLLEELGAAFFPSQSYQIYSGDTIIGIFTSTTQLRILSLKRKIADYYVIDRIVDFRDLVTANALMGGQYYLVKGYDYPSGDNPLNWEILFFATSSSTYDPNVRIRPEVGTAHSSNSKKFYDAQTTITSGSIGSGDVFLTGDTGSEYPISRFIADYNANEIFWSEGASAFVRGGTSIGLFNGKVTFDQFGSPIYQNVQNITDYAAPWIGKILNSTYWSDVRFYANSGSADQYWGNGNYENPTGLSQGQMNALQVAFDNTGVTMIATPQATYSVVNDMVTCYFSMEISSPWNKGSSGRELWLYLPLPFTAAGDGQCFGHGSVRNTTDANFSDNGAIVEYINNQTAVRLSAKHANAISSNKNCTVKCSIMYRTNVIYTPE